MMSKTDQLKLQIKKQNWEEAFALAKTFRIWDNQKDREIITIAHEMKHSEEFYKSLGYNRFKIQEEAKSILKRIYG